MNDERLRRCVSEAAGTFILVLIGPGAAAVDRSFAHGTLGTVGVGLAFFFALLAGIVAFAPVSGAHLNPAVTIAFWSIRRFPARDVAPYVLAQCVGATLAAVALHAVLGNAILAAATIPAIPLLPSFGVEFVFSAVLMAVILRVSGDVRVSPGLAALSIAACVGGLALLGALTGSSMNPARSLGPAVAASAWRAHWLYWAAPIAGMVVVAWAYEMLGRRGATLEPRPTTTLGVEGPIRPVDFPSPHSTYSEARVESSSPSLTAERRIDNEIHDDHQGQ